MSRRPLLDRRAFPFLRNRGDGGFEPRADIHAGGPVERLLAADLDADGDTDLLAWEEGSFDGDAFGTALLANDGSGAFRPRASSPSRTHTGWTQPTSTAMGSSTSSRVVSTSSGSP